VPAVIDLHTHSTVSDGSDPPAEVVARAAAAGCTALALTDHDSVAGLPEAAEAAAAASIILVPGCEVSCVGPVPAGTDAASSAHVLVYFAGGDGGPLDEELAALRRDRHRRNMALIDRLQQLGVPVRYEAVVARAGHEEGVGRPHVAAELVALGAAEDVDDAFDRWLGTGRPAHVPKARLVPAEVADVARRAGGVAVLAHPLSLGLSTAELERFVASLAQAGFAGIEAVYGRYRPDERRGLERLAARHGLVATGGSDYHGRFKPDLAVGTGLGDLRVPDERLAQLSERRPG
jgi:predicted metal-dependent phosphoesterase TrpH